MFTTTNHPRSPTPPTPPPPPPCYYLAQQDLSYMNEKVEIPPPPPLPKHQYIARSHTISHPIPASHDSSPRSSFSSSGTDSEPSCRPKSYLTKQDPPHLQPRLLRRTLPTRSNESHQPSLTQPTDVPSRRTSRYYQNDPELQAKLDNLIAATSAYTFFDKSRTTKNKNAATRSE
ncbi:hypothetical protein DM01DRAFT_1342266 [Hesseltinella vesiculosa]|uniref:Uncharacterized protein n=1 Tax=Hesseltinella vesiculosa TaxID=101127 RepID=A0A1X2GWL7_9FUNG|nr:hypothetical protein DM01DRAFT_1342266 [Hesseltinella vesiculosa]